MKTSKFKNWCKICQNLEIKIAYPKKDNKLMMKLPFIKLEHLKTIENAFPLVIRLTRKTLIAMWSLLYYTR